MLGFPVFVIEGGGKGDLNVSHDFGDGGGGGH